MVRVINYFDTQVRVPTGEDVNEHLHNTRVRNHERNTSTNGTPEVIGTNGAPDSNSHGKEATTFEGELMGSSAALRRMTDAQKASWYGKILDSVRLRYRKLQRFARSVLITMSRCTISYAGILLET